MTKYINDIRELIGKTPLIKLNNLGIDRSINLFAKLELFNPGGSVKDRVGIAMIHDAEQKGLLHKGATIVEATAGNTGIGIALAALNSGYKVIFTVPEKFSVEKVVLMEALGAKVIRTPAQLGLEGATQLALELLTSIPHAISLQQFENMANPNVHYTTTAPEIFHALDGKIDYFIAGAGSGGTFSGVAKFLKEQNSSIKTILVDPIGSIMGGGDCGSYSIEGIGNGFIPKAMDMNLVDSVIKVSDAEALHAVRVLGASEGIIAGSSSGAALAGVLKFLPQINTASNVVTLFPDRGERYFSKNIFAPND